MNKILKYIVLTILIGCSDPFEFDLKEPEIFIFDAKISTTIGNTYVTIEKTVSSVDEAPIDGLDVRVFSSEGDVFDFTYNSEQETYLPAPNFSAKVGVSYRLQATTSDGHTFESEEDTVPGYIAFNVAAKDTTVFELSSSNIVVEKNALAISAQIVNSSDTAYGFLQYAMKYADFYTLDTATFSSLDEFALISLEGADNVSNLEVPLEIYQRRNWRFVDFSPECDEQRVFLFECPFPCCREFDNYLVEFSANLESVSPFVYRYWEDAKRLRGNDGLIFDTYPFPLKGNISCTDCEDEVVGLFRAVSETKASKFENL